MALPLQLLIESSQRSVGIFHIFLRLLPHVEDRTVLTRTQDILNQKGRRILVPRPARHLQPKARNTNLMEGPLATLTLCP